MAIVSQVKEKHEIVLIVASGRVYRIHKSAAKAAYDAASGAAPEDRKANAVAALRRAHGMLERKDEHFFPNVDRVRELKELGVAAKRGKSGEAAISDEESPLLREGVTWTIDFDPVTGEFLDLSSRVE